MQAIQTKYIGATNTKHSRIKAACEAGVITVSYDHSLNECDNHKAACVALLNKMGWTTGEGYKPMTAGMFGNCYYWVFSDVYMTTGTAS